MLKDIVSKKLIACEPDTRVSEIAKLMEGENVGCVLVLKNGVPKGVVTDRDIVVRCLAKGANFADCSAETIMTQAVRTVQETDGLFDCIRAMREGKVRRIPVVDQQGKAVGIVSSGDILGVLGDEITELAEAVAPSERQRLKAA